MIKLIKEGDEILHPEKYEYCYKLVEDNQPIGFGAINKNKENALFIFINKEHRGKGYGKILFSKILAETKNIGYNDVKITFSKENTAMQKIAEDSGGKQISEDEDSIKYMFSLKE